MELRNRLIALGMIATFAATPAAAGETEAALIGAVLGNLLGSKTKLEDEAGRLEGAMITNRLLVAAAIKIKEDADLESGAGILLIGNEDLPIGLSDELRVAMAQHLARLKLCAPSQPPPKNGGGRGSPAPGGVLDAVSTAIAKADAPSKTYTGFAIKVEDSALVAAIQSVANGWSRPSDVMLIAPDNVLAAEWKNLVELRQTKADVCESRKETKPWLDDFDYFADAITSSGKNGEPPLLVQAERIEQVRKAGANVLRVSVESAGGTLINSDNLLTRLGLPAVSLTGGAIVSYRVLDPSTGRASSAGLIVCNTPQRSLGQIHKGKLPDLSSKQCFSSKDIVSTPRT